MTYFKNDIRIIRYILYTNTAGGNYFHYHHSSGYLEGKTQCLQQCRAHPAPVTPTAHPLSPNPCTGPLRLQVPVPQTGAGLPLPVHPRPRPRRGFPLRPVPFRHLLLSSPQLPVLASPPLINTCSLPPYTQAWLSPCHPLWTARSVQRP